jgi:heme-degrading monooxygenase HmoA
MRRRLAAAQKEDAMYARLSRFAGLPAERIEETIREFEQDYLPAIEQAPGFEGIVLGVDWNAGKAAAVSFWESREALQASDRAATQARQAAIDRTEPERDPVVDNYEVVLQRKLDLG